MAKVRYNKDKMIKVFYLKVERDVEGYAVVTKTYVHPINSYIWACFRDLKSTEILANKQAQDDTEAQFIINRRKIEKDMYIEYNRPYFGKTVYQITGIDGWSDNTNEIKISVKKVNSVPNYDGVEGTDW